MGTDVANALIISAIAAGFRCVVAPAAQPPAASAVADEPPPLVIDAGPLRMTVYVSRTAHLFHVVDQLAAWSEFCHRQYGRNFGELAQRDREMLKRHAALRAQRGWGGGLEQTFYTSADLEGAIQRGLAEKWIDAEQARIEREVLTHFAARVETLMQAETPCVLAFRARLEQEGGAIREFATKASRFCGDARADVPVYLLANPDDHNFGGGYNGGRLNVEVPRKEDCYPVFLHEVMHVFINTQESRLTAAVRDVPGLDYQTLNEGIAHALAPGLFRQTDAADDKLLAIVRRTIREKKPLSDAHTRFHRYALALRPLLAEALEDEKQTLETFVPRAIDVWRVVRELDIERLTAGE